MTITVTEFGTPTETPTPNVELLQATLRRIEERPKEWVQEDYRCGTAGCFAFNAVMVHYADKPEWAEPGDAYNAGLVAEADDPRSIAYGWWPTTHVSDRAQRLLGLNDGQRFRLFYAGNSLDDLRRIVADLSGGIDGMDPTFRAGAR